MAESMASLLECPICLGPFTDPRMLGCLHTLCHKCLSDLIATTGQSGQFNCPSCRKPQLTPSGGADGFQKNFFVNTYMDTVKKTEGATPSKAHPRNHPCNSSEDGDKCTPAEYFCTDCCEYYCKTCSKVHRRSNATRSHTQVLLDEVTPELIRVARAKSETPRCPKHKDEKLKLYCNSCQCAVCSVCCHISHQSHTFKEMDDVDVELKAELEALMAKLQNLSDGVERESEQIKASQEKLEANSFSARATTENTFKKLVQMLNEKAKEIDQSLKKKAEDGHIQAAAKNKNLSLRGDLLGSLETFAHDLLNKGTVFNRLVSLPEIRNRLQEMKTQPLPSEEGTLTRSIPSSTDLLEQSLKAFTLEKVINLRKPGFPGSPCLKIKLTCFIDEDKRMLGGEGDYNKEKDGSTKEEKPTPLNRRGQYSLHQAGMPNQLPKEDEGDFGEYFPDPEPKRSTQQRQQLPEQPRVESKKSAHASSDGKGDLAAGQMNTYVSVVNGVRPKAFGHSGRSAPPVSGNGATTEGHMTSSDNFSNGAPSKPKSSTNKEKEDCAICMDSLEMKKTKSLKCGHAFCVECIDQALKHKKVCPVCGTICGKLTGNQPRDGRMNYKVDRYSHLAGYEEYGTIVIDYYFRSGLQGEEHPNPGKRYDGTTRTAYLPDNKEGNEVLQLLKRAFDARLTFTIGQSVTTGLTDQVTWNDIFHKTSKYSGSFGYPDSTYLQRIKDELAAKGIE